MKNTIIADLKKRIHALENGGKQKNILPFGIPHMDGPLDGGLRLGALHEISGPAAFLFVCCLLHRLSGPILWCNLAHTRMHLYPPALFAFGLDPARFIAFHGHRQKELLYAANEGLQSTALDALVMETRAALDLTCARQLHLAAQDGQTLGLIIDRRPAGISSMGLVPTARTRWYVRLVEAPHRPGILRVSLQLLRNRAGRPHTWTLDILYPKHDNLYPKHDKVNRRTCNELSRQIIAKQYASRTLQQDTSMGSPTCSDSAPCEKTICFSLVSPAGGGTGHPAHAGFE